MQHIDEARLESDLAYRFQYLAEFVEFTPDDVAAIHRAAELLAPLVPQLVDAVYVKLFSYDATKRHFVPRQSGYDGDVPESIDSLQLDHDVIQFRKSHLARYLQALVTREYNAAMVGYLDMVGKIHTPHAGAATLQVQLVQMTALTGYVADALITTLLDLELDRDVERQTVRAFNKLLWLQNDLINRHYVDQGTAVA